MISFRRASLGWARWLGFISAAGPIWAVSWFQHPAGIPSSLLGPAYLMISFRRASLGWARWLGFISAAGPLSAVSWLKAIFFRISRVEVPKPMEGDEKPRLYF